MKLELVDKENKELNKQIEISDNVILAEPNEGLVHQLLMLQHTRKQRTANTKTRAQVRGGGRKPWNQKGTGRARAGSLRSPLFAGGGVIFGPQTHVISKSMPKKARRKALASALTLKLEELSILDSLPVMTAPKTSEASEFVNSFRAETEDKKLQKVLILADQHDEANNNLFLSLNNLEKVKVIHWQNLNPHDLMNADRVICDEVTIKRIEGWLNTYKRGEA